MFPYIQIKKKCPPCNYVYTCDGLEALKDPADSVLKRLICILSGECNADGEGNLGVTDL